MGCFGGTTILGNTHINTLSFVCLINTWMTLLRGIMVNVPYLKKTSPNTRGTACHDEKRGPVPNSSDVDFWWKGNGFRNGSDWRNYCHSTMHTDVQLKYPCMRVFFKVVKIFHVNVPSRKRLYWMQRCPCQWYFLKEKWLVVSNMFYFHPYLGKSSNLTCAYVSDRLVKNHQLENQLFSIGRDGSLKRQRLLMFLLGFISSSHSFFWLSIEK